MEFALCLLPLLLILGGIIDFGQAWYMQSVLATASREGVRYATYYYDPTSTGKTTSPSNRNVSDYVTGKYASILPGLTITLGGATTSTTTGDQVSVTATVPKQWFVLGNLIPGLPSQLQSTTWMAME